MTHMFRKAGFRRVGRTEFLCLAKDPHHSSRSLKEEEDGQLPPSKIPVDDNEADYLDIVSKYIKAYANYSQLPLSRHMHKNKKL